MGRVSGNLGIGAIVCLKWKSIRPLATVKQLFPNDYQVRRGNFAVVGIEEDYNFDGASTRCLKLSYAEDDGNEFFCKFGSGKLISRGPPNQYFRAEPTAQTQQQSAQSAPPQLTNTTGNSSQLQQQLPDDIEHEFEGDRSDQESETRTTPITAR